MLHWMGRTALEIVGQAGLGHSFDPLVEDCEDPYSQAVKAIACVILPYFCMPVLVALSGLQTQPQPALALPMDRRARTKDETACMVPTRGTQLVPCELGSC